MGLRRPAPTFSSPPPSQQPPRPIEPEPEPQPFDDHDDDDLFRAFEARPPMRQPATIPTQPPQVNTKKKRRLGKKKGLLALLVLLLVGGAGYWFGLKPYLEKRKPVASNAPAAEEQKAPQKVTGNFRLMASGDFITHDSVNQNAQISGGYDYAPMLSEIKPLLEKSNSRICHNTVPASGGTVTGYPSFNAPPELIKGLGSSGCNIMGLASDHINDKGQAAIDATRQAIEQEKSIVTTAGANRSPEEQAAAQYFNVGDGAVKFVYFSYTNRQANPGSTPHGVNVYNKDAVKQQIQAVRATADFVLVSMCWGKEDSADIQPDQDTIAQELADAGADFVFGHCTHVVQPVKKLKAADGSRETTVYYSLGNALSSQLPIETLIGGFAVIDIDLETKRTTSAGFLPTYMHYDWTAAEKAAKTLNARKNLKLYPLDKAEAPLAASQNGTTMQAQLSRISEVVNRFTPTKMVTSADF
jgi:hypothetical protein